MVRTVRESVGMEGVDEDDRDEGESVRVVG